MAKLVSNERLQFLDGNGDPYSGAQLFTYEAGSSTKEATFSDSAGTTPNTNPIVLDSDGRTPNQVFLTEGQSYKFVLAPSGDTDPPGSPILTDDDITGINDTTTTVDQWVASGLTPTYVSATQFTLEGDQTNVFHVGRRIKTTNSGGTIYSFISASSYSSNTTITVVNDSGTLDAGLSAVSYGILSQDNPSIPKLETAQYSDDSVTLAKMASGTAGHLISYDSSGDPQTETYKKRVIMTASNPTSGSSVEFTGIPSSVEHITIEGVQIDASSGNQVIHLQAGYGATPTWMTTSGDYHGANYAISVNTVPAVSVATSAWDSYADICETSTNSSTGFKVTMTKTSDGSNTTWNIISFGNKTATNYELHNAHGTLDGAQLGGDLSAVRITLASGTFVSGNITCTYYGNSEV